MDLHIPFAPSLGAVTITQRLFGAICPYNVTNCQEAMASLPQGYRKEIVHSNASLFPSWTRLVGSTTFPSAVSLLKLSNSLPVSQKSKILNNWRKKCGQKQTSNIIEMNCSGIVQLFYQPIQNSRQLVRAPRDEIWPTSYDTLTGLIHQCGCATLQRSLTVLFFIFC